ncbi:cation transporter [Neoehrlichia mikurensis]|uniref:Cation diffusion facilitator family transporter n=1 Tax=Neoehrlichia mikurensis TaxID=89586 RepID=A0A9Q9F5X9_9RICK|nr:cation diffusion facilitator family transporter [Neoehrlichia mikurensis]QXK92291.1 cation transporter [Neoehrlichia mikurensis]QXK92745.1 cation transporter [Neoehrlichia mikurensis]QXK93986.1 cation transporter [Neoehrlichia mikurensis]UTO55851.1 cation diffusion facilitator family transporter [Neoehrlichia mikurensis]UTO56766.1 cation diffusion facilitator family transporter [Neoehrlichia mikurensis]
MSSVHNGKPSVYIYRLVYAIVIIAIAMIIEVVGGIVSNSVALLSDASHMFMDFIALVFSLLAHKIAVKKSDPYRSYGYHRFQVIAAFVNGLILFAIAMLIIVESIKRFIEPVEINWRIMLVVAILGLCSNIVAFLILYQKNESNLNMRSAILHILGDLLGSIAAIISAIVIMISKWQIVDPLLSVIVSILILYSAYKIIKDSLHILLEGTPENVEANKIKSVICNKIVGVIDVHHIHVWSLTNEHIVMTVHVKVNDALINNCVDYTSILLSIKKLLNEEFNIAHATVEIEYGKCADDIMMQ